MNRKNVHLLSMIAAGMILGGGVFWFFPGSGKTVSPYEYVRQARKCIEDDKYEKAIYLLHKAYEEIPGNEDVRKNLLYAYVRYADQLEEHGKLDQAIDYLDMAYEMGSSDRVVINNLAILYCKKAVELSSLLEEYNMAMDYLNMAEEIAMTSKKARRNAANYLFNAAVRAYNNGDGRTVFICLNVSYVLYARFETLYMLGQQFYKEGDLDRAGFYWEKALVLKPDNEDLKGVLERLEKEILYSERTKEISTDHFDIQLYREYNIDEVRLKDMLNGIYDRVGKDLRCYPPSDTMIMFYDEKDFRDIFKQEGIVRGFYDGGSIRLVFTTNMDNPVFPALIAHEYTHAVISLFTGNKCPVWLNEGIAVFEQARYMELSYDHVISVLENEGSLSIEQIDKGFSMLDDTFAVTLSYEGSHTAVLFILDQWGWAGLRGLLERIKSGSHFANAIDEEFYISVSVFEKMWNRYLRENIKLKGAGV